MLESLRLYWHRWSTRRKMDRVFSRGEDPYRYKDSEYERARLDAMERVLGPRRFKHVLEIGAAEGAFTSRLAGMSDRVTAMELSKVALDRARAALAGKNVSWAQADVRAWEPPAGTRYDAVVCGDVLYYLDKPLVQDAFEAAFERIAGWLEPGGVLLLAHGFAGDIELGIRRGYRERFQAQGLELVSEEMVGKAEKDGDVRCLLCLLKRS